MAGCGYVCPACEGRGFTDDGADCTWCLPQKAIETIASQTSLPYQYYALYKPYGYLSQFVCEHNNKKLLGELYDFPEGVMPIGRLDEPSEGLLLLSNHGKLHEHLLAHHVEKEYWVLVEGHVNDDTIKQLSEGVGISTQSTIYQTKPAIVSRLNNVNFDDRKPRVRYHPRKQHTWLSITIKEGRYRQVRKMTAVVGHPTLRLVRMRIGNLMLHQQVKPASVFTLAQNDLLHLGLLPLS
jgi:23S rRNA pseudouridine2457 synthase